VADAGDEQPVVWAKLAKSLTERLDVGAIVRLNDEGRFEWQVDDDAETGDGVVQLAIVGTGREAVPDEEEITRARELGAADQDAGIIADFDPQIPDEELGVASLGHPDVPTLIKVGLGTETPHGVGNPDCQLAFIANLKKLDIPHHALPQNCQSMPNDSTQLCAGDGRLLE
jgi:hypothetical protein